MEDLNLKSGKIPMMIVMPDGTTKTVEFTDVEYSIADGLVRGDSHQEIATTMGVSTWHISNLIKNGINFNDLLLSRKHFAGRAAALTQDFVKAKLFELMKTGVSPDKGKLEVIKMAMIACGLSKQVERKKKDISGFSITAKTNSNQSGDTPSDSSDVKDPVDE